MNANGSVTLQGFARKVVRHVELNIDKPSHGSADFEMISKLLIIFEKEGNKFKYGTRPHIIGFVGQINATIGE